MVKIRGRRWCDLELLWQSKSGKIQAMFATVRFMRALLLIGFLCAAGRVYSTASAHVQKNELSSHHSKIPDWTGEAEQQGQSTPSDLALLPIPGNAPDLPNLASAVIPLTTNAVCRTKQPVLRQRPPPPRSLI
jgi:hypothetical protein